MSCQHSSQVAGIRGYEVRALLQRVTSARVEIEGQVVGAIGHGLLVFLAVYPDDGDAQVGWLLDKLLDLRVFADAEGRMNLSVREVDGGVLLVSQFTLAGDTRRGRRPGFSAAAPPAQAEAIYERFLARLQAAHPRVAAGRFGADMQVHLVNDGPVTLLVDTPIIDAPL